MLFSFIILTIPWWSSFLQTGSYDQKGNIYRYPVNGIVDDTGIAINGRDIKSSFMWSTYTHSLKSGGVVILYQGKNCFHIFIPSMFASDEEWRQFEEMVQKNLKKK